MEPEGSLPHSQASATRPYPGLAQTSPHTANHLLQIHHNIIHPSTPRTPQRSLSLRFPHQDLIRLPLLPHTSHMPSPFHSSWFYHPHHIRWGVQTFSSSLCNLLHSPVTSSLLGPNILLNTIFSNTLSFLSSLAFSDQASHPYKTTGKIIRTIYLSL